MRNGSPTGWLSDELVDWANKAFCGRRAISECFARFQPRGPDAMYRRIAA